MEVKRGGIRLAQRVQEGTSGEPERAQPVQDRLGEPPALGKGRVRVEGVAVTAQPVEQRLVGSGLIRHDVVGRSIGRGIQTARRAAVASPAPLVTNEPCRGRTDERLARRHVDSFGLGHHDRSGPLVVDGGDPRLHPDRSLHRQLSQQLERLATVDVAGRVVGAELVPRHPAHADHDPEGGQDPLGDPVGVLGGEFELEPGRIEGAGSDAHRVEKTVLRCPRSLVGLGRRTDRIWIDWHRLTSLELPPPTDVGTSLSGEDGRA